METAVGHGLHAAPWADDRPGAHVARAAKFMVWSVDAGHGCPISMTYAVVPALRANPELAAQFEPLLTNREYDPGLADPVDQARPDRRHVDDREAGRLRRTGQHDDGAPVDGGGRHLRAGRPQVVHLGADVGHVPDARAGAGRAVLLPGAAGAARRRTQRDALPPPQGQARQQVQRLVRDRVRRRDRLAGRRGGPRRPDHRRDGQHDPARLRHRHRRPACAPHWCWPPTTPATAVAFGKPLDRAAG